MRHPIQRLHVCAATARLYTGTSNALHVFSSASGENLGSWTAAPGNITTVAVVANEDEGPKKKRKVEGDGDGQGQGKGKGKDGKGKEGKEKKKKEGGGKPSLNAITKILTVKSGEFVLVATNDDKAVTVLRTEGLKVMSVRHLPKRVVDLAFVERTETILCADKFGDVFGIPLFASDSGEEPSQAATTTTTAAPAATTTTADVEMANTEKVYESEEQKARHLEKARLNSEREAVAAERRKRLHVDYNIPFAHDFVLGHVSMLLSLLTITLPASHPAAGGKEKTWVLTSDRDEHIRVTRYPQSYVIEGFCLGHTQFVKTLHAPSWDLTSLISGGGDEYLLVWNWRERRALQKVDLVAPVQAVLGADAKIFVPKTADKGEAEAEDADASFKFAVSGLWEVPEIRGILVGIESVPALFLFSWTPEGLQYTSTLSLPGNFLDAAVSPAESKVYVSVDPLGDPLDGATPLLAIYNLTAEGVWTPTPTATTEAATIEQAVVQAVDVSEEVLAAVKPTVMYSVASLRKEYGIRGAEDREA